MLARHAVALFVLAHVAGCTATLTYPGAVLEDCFGGVDEDLDGLIDLADPDCALGAPCEPHDGTCDHARLECSAASHVCLPPCSPDESCPFDWACESNQCACTPCAERCNTLDDDCDGRIDESTCAVGEVCQAGTCVCPPPATLVRSSSTLDLLFVVDNSHSMEAALGTLRMALRGAIEALVTGDLDGDHVQDVAPVYSLHVGVVTTDLGVDNRELPTCTLIGNDGVLGSGTSCPGTPVFYYEAYRDSAAAFASNLDCALTLAPSGCGFGQPFAASLLTLTPSASVSWTSPDYVETTFLDGTTGHGDGVNQAFLRADSTLAVILITDGDDCSADDASFYEPGNPLLAGPDINLRCTTYPDSLTRVSAYVRRLFSLRHSPHEVFFGAIAGIPSGAGAMTPAEILALPAMQIAVDPTSPGNRLVPACTASMRRADPARRVVEAAAAVQCAGGSIALTSICDASYDAALGDILRAIGSAEDRRSCVRP